MDGMKNFLEHYSLEEIEKFKALISLFPLSLQNEVITSTREIVTLRVFIEEYQNLIRQNRSENYLRSVIISLNYLKEYFGEQRDIGSITYKETEGFLIYLQQKVKKGYEVYYRNLKAAFNKGVVWKYVKENHFIKIKLPKKQKTHPSYIDESELSLILEKIEIEVVKEFVIIAFYTGMRLNEIVNLTWKNIDLEKKIITVGDEDFETKGKNQRYIPISDEVLNVLIRILPKPPLVFPIGKGNKNFGYVFSKPSGEKYTGDYFSKRFKRACRAAGINKGIHFHSLRHSFASNLAQREVSLYAIKELMGHSTITTTEIYSHLNIDSLKKAISVFDKPYTKERNRNEKVL